MHSRRRGGTQSAISDGNVACVRACSCSSFAGLVTARRMLAVTTRLYYVGRLNGTTAVRARICVCRSETLAMFGELLFTFRSC